MRLKFLYSVLFIISTFLPSLYGQECGNQNTLFSATLDPSKTFIANDWGIQGLWNANGEYVTLGIKDDRNSVRKFNLFFEKLDENGNATLSKEIAFSNTDYSIHQELIKSTHITQIFESGQLTGYAVAATIKRFSLNATRVVIFRLDLEGCVVWLQERLVNENITQNEFAKGILQNKFGDLIILITTSDNTTTLTEISAGGSFSETNEYKINNINLVPSSIVEVSSSASYPTLSYVVTGVLEKKLFLLPLERDFDVLGNMVKSIDLDNDPSTLEYAQKIALGPNQKLLISGFMQDINSNQYPFLTQLSLTPETDGSFGKLDFTRNYELNNQTNNQFALDMMVNAAGESYIGGYSYTNGNQPSSFIFKTNANGTPQWAKNYEDLAEFGYIISVTQVGEEGFFAVGGKWNSLENRRAFILKGENDGDLCKCHNDLGISSVALSGKSTIHSVLHLRPDWNFQFPNLVCSNITIPQRFCEQSIALGPEVTFTIQKLSIDCDASSFCMAVSVNNFKNVKASDFSINWNAGIIRLDSAKTATPPFFNGSTINTSQAGSGKLGFSWKDIFNNTNGITLIDNTPVLELCFTVLDNNIGIERVTFSDMPTAKKVEVVNFKNARFKGEDGFLTNDCQKNCSAAFIPTAIEGCGEVQIFNQSISNSIISSIQWDFGDGSQSSEFSPTHIYDASGSYTIELTIVDNENCQDTYSETVSVTIDNVAPTMLCPDAIFIECSKSLDPENTGYALSEDNCGDEVNIVYQDQYLAGNDCSYLFRRTWIAEDESGNIETCEQIISVVDRTGPIISNCPDTITVNSDGNSCSNNVTIPSPTATDECNEVTSFVNDFNNSSNASGNYPAGETIVTWTATDACGNISKCSHVVNVKDVIKPVVQCIDDIILTNNGGEAGKNVNFPVPVTTDDCGATVMFSRQPGSFFLCGTTEVTYFAVDEAGNESEVCSFNVIINCGDVVCCESQSVFDGKIAGGLNAAVDSNEVFISAYLLNNCNKVIYDWGDGFSSSAVSGTAGLSHIYKFPGAYTICAQVQEISANNEVCYQETICTDICISFEACETEIFSNSRVFNMGGQAFESASAVALAPNGDVYLAGSFSGKLNLGGEIRNPIGNKDIFLAKYDGQTGNLLWSTQAGGISDDVPKDLEVDAAGNVYMVGGFNSQNFSLFSAPKSGGSATTLVNDGIICSNTPQGCLMDGFAAKYNADGVIQWAFSIGEQEEDCISGIAIDENASILITGYFALNTDFDPSEASFNLNGGSRNAFVGKYGPEGTFIWAFDIGGTNAATQDEGTSIAVDDRNNIYVTGFFSGENVDFNPANSVQLLLSAGTSPTQKDIFVARYDNEGDLVWAYDIGNNESNRVNSGQSLIVKDRELYLTGRFNGSVATDFDPKGDAIDQNLTPSTNSDIFVAKYDDNFNYQWAFNIEGDGNGKGIAIDPLGQILVVGEIKKSVVDFNPATSQNANVSNKGNSDIFLAKYQSDGSFIDVILPGGQGEDHIEDLAVSADGNIYLAGSFITQSLLPDPEFEYVLPNKGGSDIFFGIYRCGCPKEEICKTNCDFIDIDYGFTASNTDSCCFNLIVDNKVPNNYSSIRLIPVEGVYFQSWQILQTGWKFTMAQRDSLQIESGTEYIATDSLLPIAFCLGTKDGSPQKVIVELMNIDEIVCVDTLTFNCEVPAIPQCIEIENSSLACENDQLVYTFEWKNLASFSISKLTLSGIQPAEIEVNPNMVSYNPEAETGRATFNFSPLIAGQEICFSIDAQDANGQSFCVTDTLCIPELTEVCDPCDQVSVTISATENEKFSCCFTIDLSNGFTDGYFSGIQTSLPDGQSFIALEAGADWAFEKINSLGKVFWKPTESFITKGSTNGKINFCIGGPGESSAKEIFINWVSKDDNASICADTLTVNCNATPKNQCLEVNTGIITCSESGLHELQLNIKNTSDFRSKRFQIIPVRMPNGVLFSDDSVLSANVEIESGGNFEIPKLTIENGQTGDTICIEIEVYDTVDGLPAQMARKTEQLCYVLPDCIGCACMPWSGISVSSPQGKWAAFNNVECGDKITLPSCEFDFCLTGNFSCSEDTCGASYRLSLLKSGQATNNPLVMDLINANQIDRCFSLGTSGLPGGGPGLYELHLNGLCSDRACDDCVLFIEIACAMDCSPIMECPADITLDCPGVLELPLPIFRDTCGNRTFTCSRSDLKELAAPFTEASTTITCIATNENGLKDTCTYNVLVANTTPFTFQCPENVSITLPIGATSGMVDFDDPLISNNCNIIWTYSRMPGSIFECGATTVEAIAIDTLLKDTVSCTFEVIVKCLEETDCNQLLVDYRRDESEPDDCCFYVTLNNQFDTDRYKGVIIRNMAPVMVESIQPLNGWRLESDMASNSFRLLPSGEYIEKDRPVEAFRICTDGFTTIPHNLELSWIEIDLDEEKAICPTLLSFECDTVKCCQDEAIFMERANKVAVKTTIAACRVLISVSGLGPCDQIFFDWDGDGKALEGPFGNETEIEHIYPTGGNYRLCYSIEETNKKGEQCWEAIEGCEDITIVCESVCCISERDFEKRVASGFTYNIDNCKLRVTPNKLNECNSVIWNWGDGTSTETATTGNEPGTHFFKGPGNYEICMLVIEEDENGDLCWQEEKFCMELEVNCAPTCFCGNFDNIKLGPNQTSFTCGQEPVILDCPANNKEFRLTGTFGCTGSCFTTEIGFTLRKDGREINKGTISLNGNVFDALFAYDLLKTPGTYVIELSGQCEGNICTCALSFIIPPSCDCFCSDFGGLVIDQQGKEYRPICNGEPINLGCTEENVFIKGFFECEGKACDPNSKITWNLITPQGTTISNTLPKGSFQLNFSTALIETPGDYKLELISNCGANTCLCTFIWEKEYCEPCPCPIDNFEIDPQNLCNQVFFNIKGLEDCDAVKIDFGDETGMVSTGNTQIVHWYNTTGNYKVKYYVERKQQGDDQVCVFADSLMLDINCLNSDLSSGEILRNGGFVDIDNDLPIDWTVGDTATVTFSRTGNSCMDANQIDFLAAAGVESGQIIIYQEDLSIAKDGRYQLKMCLSTNRVFGLENIIRIPGIQIYAIKKGTDLKDIGNCLDDCQLIAQCPEIFTPNKWIEMNLGIFRADDNFEGLLVKISDDPEIFSSRTRFRIDNISILSNITSIKRFALQDGINLYPNPTSSNIHMKFKQPLAKEMTARIVNIFGQTVFTATVSRSTEMHTIDLAPYAKGVYILQLTDNKGEVYFSDRVILQ